MLTEPARQGAHPRAARFDGAGGAAVGHRAGRAGPCVLHGRGCDRRAQPGARRHAQRAHVRAGATGAGSGADDEHLLDLPGGAERVSGAPGRERRIPRSRQLEPRGRGAQLYKGPRPPADQQELPVAAGRGDRAREPARTGQAAAEQPQGGPVLRLLHRAPARAPADRRRAPPRPLPGAADRDARRHGHRVCRDAQVLRLSDHHHEQGRLAEAGRPSSRRRGSRRGGAAS